MPWGTRQRGLSHASSFEESSIPFNFLSAGLYENNTALLKCINDMIDDPEENKTERTIEKHLLCEHNHYTVRAGPNYKRILVGRSWVCVAWSENCFLKIRCELKHEIVSNQWDEGWSNLVALLHFAAVLRELTWLRICMLIKLCFGLAVTLHCDCYAKFTFLGLRQMTATFSFAGFSGKICSWMDAIDSWMVAVPPVL